MFKSFQDRELLIEVRAACAWKDLWIFVDVYYERVLVPLENARRWGLACLCCKHIRHDTVRRARCPRASRRLREARQFCINLVAKFNASSGELTFAECGECTWIFTEVSLALRSTGVELSMKSAWTKRAPWLMSEGDDPVQAAEIVRQLEAADDSCLESLPLYYKRELLDSLKAFDVI